jgi:diguanylate cyclase (GGDEF)-like protein
VNDTFGHEVGNRVLKLTAHHLREVVRDVDIVARYGGEEFAVICPQTSLEDAARLAERIRTTLSQRTSIPEHPELILTASFGVASANDARVKTVTDLINLGDQSLYLSKRSGRNRITRSDQINEHVVTETDRDRDMDRLEKQVATLSLQAKEVYLKSVWSLVQALEARDHYTAWHSRNVTFFTSRLLGATRWTPALRAATSNAAMLHDLGKIGVPDQILQKVDPLTEDELRVLREVPLATCAILEPMRMFQTEILIIRHLRERFDGSGYPDRLKGEDIPVASRLLTVVETFESLTSDRVYRSRRTCEEAIALIRQEAGAQFDPQFVDLLERTYHEQLSLWQAQIAIARSETARRTRQPNLMSAAG